MSEKGRERRRGWSANEVAQVVGEVECDLRGMRRLYQARGFGLPA